MKEIKITCKDCVAYADTHSSCQKARFGEVDKNTPACKDIKYIKKCKDCVAYADTHSSCDKVRSFEVDANTFACKNIKLKLETIESLKTIKDELISNQEQEIVQDSKSKTYKYYISGND